MPVKNGAELLDRLIKDIVTEQASTYVSATTIASRPSSPHPSTSSDHRKQEPERAFSLPRFIPLLRERIYVLNPFTRTYLVSWLTVLDSVPELELVSFLPDFLDGLLKFLGDPTVDIRTATQNVLADFLREIREVAEVGKMREDEWKGTVRSRSEELEGKLEDAVGETGDEGDDAYDEDEEDEEGSGEWIPGQGVQVDHAAIVEILLEHSSFPGQSCASLREGSTDFRAQTRKFNRLACAGSPSFSTSCNRLWSPLLLDSFPSSSRHSLITSPRSELLPTKPTTISTSSFKVSLSSPLRQLHRSSARHSLRRRLDR